VIRFNAHFAVRMLASLTGCALLAPSLQARTLDMQRPEVTSFVAEMHDKHGLDPQAVEQLLAQAEIKQGILDAISKPAERTLKWYEYRPIFITEKRISQGSEFWQAHKELLDQVSQEFGVSPEALVAIVGVETYYGRITGSHRVLDALSTLAFEYPPRADFFRSQLEEFLVLSGESGVDPLVATGSYAGAMGAPQFIPTSFRAYAVDHDKDGRIDLWENWQDVLASVANYFKAHGWRTGEEIAARATRHGKAIPGSRDLAMDTTVGALRAAGWEFETSLPAETPAMAIKLQGTGGPEYWVGFNNFQVITRYNHSVMYAMAVNQLAQELTHRINLVK
jgi:membrane-bound lytic murein transglycosylase B